MIEIVNHSIELEHRVLEGLMHVGIHTTPVVRKAFLTLTIDCFYNPLNRQVFQLIKRAYQAQESFGFVDILVLIGQGNEHLHEHVSWMMDEYGNLHVTDSKLESDIEALLEYSTLRQQVAIFTSSSLEIPRCANSREAQKLVAERVSQISSLSYRKAKHGIESTQIEKDFYDGKITQKMVLPTTSISLNRALGGGIRAKSLITIAAGAGVGKTGFAIYLMDCIARMSTGTSLFFSLEMESTEIWMRHVAIRAGKLFECLSDNELKVAVESTHGAPIIIYDHANSKSASDINFILDTSRCKAMESRTPVIVVDYLGLVQNPGQFERNDLKQADVTNKLAALAIELDCIVIALSQINRGSSTRAKDDRCPYPDDAADSSGSHRSSALWLGVDRPELYQDDPCYENQFIVKCRKNRFGGNFELLLAFNGGTFAEVRDDHFKSPAKVDKNGYGRPYLDE